MPAPTALATAQPFPRPAPALPRYELFIDGRFCPARSGRTFLTENPYTGEPWAEVADAGAEDVDAAVAAARAAFEHGPWSRLNGSARGRLMRRLADLVRRDAERLAEIETRDNGKLLKEMLAQWRYLPEWLDYFGGAADKIEGASIPADRPNFAVFTRREPVGVVAAITPWNSPALLLAFKLAPALAAGCTMVVKPSEYTPASTLELARLVAEAEFPPGVVNVVAGGREAGAMLASHPGVDKIAFTGSTATGRCIVKAAADTPRLARVSLELGGKSPQVVFADADLEAATNGVIAGVFAATGQTCMAGSRLLVERSVHDDLIARLAARAATIRLGDPMDPATEMGPVANAPQLEKVLDAIEGAVAGGAKLVIGGPDRDRGGLFVRPTILTGVENGTPVAQDEIFGPVLAVIPFEGEDEAVRLANDTVYGLAAAVWTKDVHRAHRVAARLRAGTVWVNAYRTVSYSTPFGGFGASGWGRENGLEAIRAYTETKAVWIELTGATRDPFTLG